MRVRFRTVNFAEVFGSGNVSGADSIAEPGRRVLFSCAPFQSELDLLLPA